MRQSISFRKWRASSLCPLVSNQPCAPSSHYSHRATRSITEYGQPAGILDCARSSCVILGSWRSLTALAKGRHSHFYVHVQDAFNKDPAVKGGRKPFAWRGLFKGLL